MIVTRADDHVVLDQRPTADHDVVADRAALTDARLVADDRPVHRCVVPAKTTAPAETTVSGTELEGRADRAVAVERGESTGCLPSDGVVSDRRSRPPITVPVVDDDVLAPGVRPFRYAGSRSSDA